MSDSVSKNLASDFRTTGLHLPIPTEVGLNGDGEEVLTSRNENEERK